jgi:hypothetical protein
VEKALEAVWETLALWRQKYHFKDIFFLFSTFRALQTSITDL